jgi:SAM-dependent methyltransferase
MFDLVICNMTLHYLPDKKKALTEMYRVLKPEGQAAIHFNGGPVFNEIIDVGFSVASRHPEYPKFKDAILEYQNNFLGFEDALSIIEEAGFEDHRTFGRQIRVFINPERALWVGESWELWKTGLPLNAREIIREELIEAFTVESEDRGFKFTYFTIITVGNKSKS